ncbi:hypothetical protein CXF31_06260, partial [Corynebacterium bovis]
MVAVVLADPAFGGAGLLAAGGQGNARESVNDGPLSAVSGPVGAVPVAGVPPAGAVGSEGE